MSKLHLTSRFVPNTDWTHIIMTQRRLLMLRSSNHHLGLHMLAAFLNGVRSPDFGEFADIALG